MIGRKSFGDFVLMLGFRVRNKSYWLDESGCLESGVDRLRKMNRAIVVGLFQFGLFTRRD